MKCGILYLYQKKHMKNQSSKEVQVRIFKEIMAENSSNLINNLHIQKLKVSKEDKLKQIHSKTHSNQTVESQRQRI